MGLDQWCSPMFPVHRIFPVVGLNACTWCDFWVVVCSPAPLAAYSTPFATNADDVQQVSCVHRRFRCGVPALSAVTVKPAVPPCPVTNTHTVESAGLVHTAPCDRMLAICGKLNSCSSPPVCPGPPLPDRSARFSSRIFESLPGCTPRCGNFLLIPTGRMSSPPLPMSWSDLTEEDQFVGV